MYDNTKRTEVDGSTPSQITKVRTMIIKGRPCIVFDVESFKNIFTCTCKNTETNELITFEMSDRKNDINAMCDYFLLNSAYFVGYNNTHYDNPVINYCIEYRNANVSTRRFVESLFNLSRVIIGRDDDDIAAWKRWKYASNFHSIDLLTMMYSKALRVSLKEMQVTMHYRNVEEFVADWLADLPLSRFDELISYNINDVESTEALLNKLKNRLELRVGIEEKYGINCLSLDDVNLGMQILAQEYMREANISRKELETGRSPCDIIDLEKVILPEISFKTPVLQKALASMKQQHNVSPGRKGYEDTFLFGDMKTTIGVGGIHGDCGTCIIKPSEDEVLLDWDVASLYPSLMIEYGFYPLHLGRTFIDVYSRIRKERLEAKHNGDKLKNECFKFCLNGLSGNLQNEYSWAYSPFTVMQVRINGQLLLLMLAEELLLNGCKLKQINTDGILFIAPKSKLEDLSKVKETWEKFTNLVLEEERFTEFYQLAINDYFGVTPKYAETKDIDRDIKKKGFFITDTILGKGLQPKIIPEAIIRYFVEGTTVEQTIKSCHDIKKFIQYEKTGKQWTVEYNEEEQQRTNRFYVSTSGYYLWKWKLENSGKSYHNMLKGYGVKLINKLDDIQQIENYDINHRYYIIQSIKIIEQLKPKQLSLWD